MTSWRIYRPNKTIHHRDTKDTEKTVFSVSFVSLW